MTLTLTAARNSPAATFSATEVARLVEALETRGAVRLPRLVSDQTLQDMQAAFASRLRFFKFNNAWREQVERRSSGIPRTVLTW